MTKQSLNALGAALARECGRQWSDKRVLQPPGHWWIYSMGRRYAIAETVNGAGGIRFPLGNNMFPASQFAVAVNLGIAAAKVAAAAAVDPAVTAAACPYCKTPVSHNPYAANGIRPAAGSGGCEFCNPPAETETPDRFEPR